MEGTEGPFDHFWGPLNANDFETSKPFFESQLIDVNDGIRDVNCHNLETSVAFDHHDPMKSVFSEEELIIKGSLAERRASKFGFNATKINWDHVSMSPVRSPGPSPVQSPYLTIPPGISPAALLESPVMLPNSQQSPTTGTFPMAAAAAAAACDDDNSVMNSLSPGTDRDSDIAVDSFGMFKPPGDFAQLHCTYNARDQPTTSSKHPTDSSSTQRDTVSFSKIETRNDNGIAGNTASISNHDNIPSPSIDRVHQQEPVMRECIKSETRIINPPMFEQEQKRVLASSTKTSNAGDGYCWRKYGQKHVKGSEYPRSYYKCNNSNCPVKKKVERSHDGEITEIIYNGAHNHPKPHLRLSLTCQDTSSEMLDSCDVSESPKLESWTGWRCNNQLMTPNGGSDWIGDGFEGTSSNPALNEICDPSSSNCQEKSGVLFGSMQQTPENATTAIVSQNGDDQDGIMQEITSPSEDADGDESEPKRRKRETFTSEAYLPSRSTREPRIILQIESEIDVLDDGYRWRKYGQKVVKGNPNPRSYYKCTSAGCPVRKHVERASEDIKSVITTYEGKHNHEVPTTKAMGAPTVGHSPQNVSDNTNPALTLPRNPNATNPEMKVQDFPMHYQMKPALGNDFTRSSLLGDFVGDMKLGVPSSIYQMKFPPPLQSPMLYSNPFMRNLNGNEFHTSTFGAPLMHDLPMMNASRTPNMVVNGFHSRPGGVVQSSIGTTQQIKENDYRFYKPKEE